MTYYGFIISMFILLFISWFIKIVYWIMFTWVKEMIEIEYDVFYFWILQYFLLVFIYM